MFYTSCNYFPYSNFNNNIGDGVFSSEYVNTEFQGKVAFKRNQGIATEVSYNFKEVFILNSKYTYTLYMNICYRYLQANFY